MPIHYSKYPADWKIKIRPQILARAKNRCESCGVKNYRVIFRGYWNKKEVYQDCEGRIYDAKNSKYLYHDYHLDEDIEPINGDQNQQAIKVVLTISHQDHNIENNNYSNLKALCQKCHNKHDAKQRASNRKYKKEQLQLFS